MLPRKPTSEEKKKLKAFFPRLDVEKVMVTGEKTRQYNCLAWTLGITTKWVWPWGSRPATKAEFDTLYRQYGYVPKGTGPIAAFGARTAHMLHGSLVGGGRWESKIGEEVRIQHGLSELENGGYGKVLGYYSKSRGQDMRDEPPQETPEGLDKATLEFLAHEAVRVAPEVRERFSEIHRAWKRDWEHPAISMSSVPLHRAYSPHFLTLYAMGPDILPLLMHELANNPEDFFALVLVDALLPAELVVTYEPDDFAILLGEQQRAAETITRWVAYRA